MKVYVVKEEIHHPKDFTYNEYDERIEVDEYVESFICGIYSQIGDAIEEFKELFIIEGAFPDTHCRISEIIMNREYTKSEITEEIIMNGKHKENDLTVGITALLRDDKEFMLKAIERDAKFIWWASRRLQKDKDIILESLDRNEDALEYASPELINNKEFMLEALKRNRFTSKYINEELRKDEKFMLETKKIKEEQEKARDKKEHDMDEINVNLKEEKIGSTEIEKVIENDMKLKETYSIEELEGILNKTLEDNKNKEEELKSELIKKIIQAQEEGNMLDEQIAQAKSQKKTRDEK